MTKDPFTPDREKFLVLGSTCSLCSKTVCVGSVRMCQNEILSLETKYAIVTLFFRLVVAVAAQILLAVLPQGQMTTL